MRSKRVQEESKFARFVRRPIRALARARDLYMESLTGRACHVSYGNAMGCPTPKIPSLPRSSSVNSNSSCKSEEEKLRDLSTRSLKIEEESRRSKRSAPLGGGERGTAKTVPRSQTVTIGRIDEDKPYEFGEDDDLGLLRKVCPRSRIHVASRKIKSA